MILNLLQNIKQLHFGLNIISKDCKSPDAPSNRTFEQMFLVNKTQVQDKTRSCHCVSVQHLSALIKHEVGQGSFKDSFN